MSFTRIVAAIANHVIEHPLLWALYLGVALLCFLLSLAGFTRKQYWYVYIALIVFVTISALLNYAYDAHHHVSRVAELSDQFKNGYFGIFVFDPISRNALPIFFFYSVLPYIVPVMLTFMFVPAFYAYIGGLLLYFIILVYGTWELSGKIVGRGEYANLATIIFISTNYVISLWVVRSAAAEILAFSLVPWVTLALVERPRSTLWVTTLLALQVASHPIVFLQCAVAEVAACIAFTTLRDALKATVLPLILAIAISSPFWAPQLIFMHAVKGNSGIPVHYESTFLTLGALLNPLSVTSPGLWGVCALMVIWLSGGARKQVAVLFGFFLCTVLLQTVFFETIVTQIPLLDTVQFVWRWMLVSCFFVLVLLLASSIISTALLRTIGALAVFNAFVICGIHLTVYKEVEARIANDLKPRDNQTVIRDYFRSRLDQSDPASQWGVGEYLPDYAKYATACGDESQQTYFSDVEKGVSVSASSALSVQEAPVGFVKYQLNGTDIAASSSCERRLSFGPFPEAGTFTVDQDLVTLVSAARYAVLAVLFACLGLVCKEARRGSVMAVSSRAG